MSACPWPMAQLLPHAGDAILIDAVENWDDETLLATALVRAEGLYNDPDGSLPPWMGLEIMAQAVGAWAGCQARQSGKAVGLGFLLGTRRYECRVERFLPGTRLSVRVARSLQDAGGMGVFECELRDDDGKALAFARLNVYRPADAGAFTQEAAPSEAPHVDGADNAHTSIDTSVHTPVHTPVHTSTISNADPNPTASASHLSINDKAAP